MSMHPSRVLPKWKFDSSVTAIVANAVPEWATHLFYSPGFAHDGPNISLVWASGDTGVVRAVDAADDSVHVHNKTQNCFLGTLKTINLGEGSLWRCLGSRVPALATDTRKAVVPPLVRIPTDFKANEDFINEMRRVTVPQAFAAPYGGKSFDRALFDDSKIPTVSPIKPRPPGALHLVDFESLEERALASYQQIAKDPYKELAAKLFEVPIAEVTKEQRQIAKRGYYMIPYLQAEQSLASVLQQATAAIRRDGAAHKRARIRALEWTIRQNIKRGSDCPPALLVERNLLREQVIELEKHP